MQHVLVEREDELEQLDRLLTAALSGSGTVAFIVGEAGVGKTRLVAEAAVRGRALSLEVLCARGASWSRSCRSGSCGSCSSRRSRARHRRCGTSSLTARRSSPARSSLAIASCWRSSIAYRRGRLADAETEARTSLEVAAARGWGGMPATWAFLVDALMGQGDLTAASEALDRSGLGGEIGDYGSWSFFLHSRGRLRLAAGDVRSAIADLRACGTRMGQWGANNPP